MATGKKRLFRVASDINIGKDTIVEYLSSKGFSITNKATTVLTPEMLELVYEKFKKEKKAVDIQREKLQKHKDIRKPAKDDKQDETQEEQVQETEENVEETKSEEIISEESTEVEEITQETTEEIQEEEKEFIEEEKETIQLEEEIQAEVEEVPQESELKEETVELREEVKQEAEPEVEKIEEIKEIQESPQIEEHVSPEAIEEDTKEIEEYIEDEVKEETPPSKKDFKNKKNKVKQRPKPEVIEEEDDEDHNLKGLTIVGKIELKKEQAKKEKFSNKRKKDKNRPKEEEVSVVSRPNKKKRKKKADGEEVAVASNDKQANANANANPNNNQPASKKAEEKKKRRKRKSIRDSIKQEDVEKAIKETLSNMDSSKKSGSRSKMKQKRKAEREEKELKIAEEAEKEAQILKLTEFVTTSDLANLMGTNPNDVILKCMELGLMVTINQRLDKETISLIAVDYGFEVEFVEQKTLEYIDEDDDDDGDLQPRPPIVTVMGHVDHGKTSLLDYVRHANVVAGEAGGITQHIAAYKVELQDGRAITFLDTPGHEAFTAMRARGAQVTDIVVLVVAADDSVMPQTIEAISHAKAADVPIVVAVNKCDKPEANPDRIKQQLSDYDLLVEEWGGTIQSVDISAKHGLNVDELLEKILLEAEMLDLKANPDRGARGTVIEAHMTKGFGTVSTIIVQKGTLKVGDPFVSGAFAGRVRALLDERGNKVKEAGPSIPIGVIGFDGLPEAGDPFSFVESDTEARKIATSRQQLRREQELRQVRYVTLDEISAQIKIGGVRELNLIIKGDVSGSVEALSDSLLKLSRDEVKVVILHKGVGAVKEGDIMLAAASNAVLIGFNVTSTSDARKLAEKENVEIRNYDIIYNCINDVHLALEGLLKPEIKEQDKAEIEVRAVFKISRIGSIAGCSVRSGKIHRNDKVRLFRDGLEIFDGKIQSLKREKDDAKEVDTGFECGIQLDGFNDIQEGDIIKAYELIEIKRTLS